MASVTEFFRPEQMRPLDADGFEIASWDRELAELEALGVPFPEPFEPSDEDELDYVMWSDRLAEPGCPAEYPVTNIVTDEDLVAAGLAVV